MFKVTSSDGAARSGELITRRGTVATPFFMPVITRSTGDRVIGPPEYHRLGVSAAECDAAAGGVAICNSLIAAFTPGAAAIVAERDVAGWLGTQSVLFTDSGGYQTSQGSSFVVSRTTTGYLFRTRWSGASLELTPESSVDLQQRLGADVAMVLDDVAPYGSDRDTVLDCLDRTHAWAERALHRRSDSAQLLFGICQGGIDLVLRERSASAIDSLGFDGTAIGGVAIIPTFAERQAAVEAAMSVLSAARPRYVMGIGDPDQIVRMVGLGVDCFDAAYPSIQARLGFVLSDRGKVPWRDWNPQWDETEACTCPTCSRTSMGALAHAPGATDDAIAPAIALHNCCYLARLMHRLREAIAGGRYRAFAEEFHSRWRDGKRLAVGG
ncbi:MAG TPA: tRNA guanosine(34) transglycosylase Tgt [Povalibacter sp.]|nr:tRNA guanosine(34) transglycosylase Tgt [Povalibacter sp.]